MSRSIVARLWRRYQETSEFSRREGHGRQRMMSQRKDRYLRNIALRNQQYTTRRLQIEFQHTISQRISDLTIGNRLHEGDLSARRPARGHIIIKQHHARRYDIPQEHQNRRLQGWRSGLFTAERRFHLIVCDRRV